MIKTLSLVQNELTYIYGRYLKSVLPNNFVKCNYLKRFWEMCVKFADIEEVHLIVHYQRVGIFDVLVNFIFTLITTFYMSL